MSPPSIALQLSGHLRQLCVGDNFKWLEEAVQSCRQVAECDLFVHTWRRLEAGTSTWSTATISTSTSPLPSGSPTSSAACVSRLSAALRPTAITVEHQPADPAALVPHIGTATWFKPGTLAAHVSLAGLVAAAHAAGSAARLRASHELHVRQPYALAVRLRPDVYRPTIARPTCWQDMLRAATIGVIATSLPLSSPASRNGTRAAAGGTVWGCTRQLGRKNSDACFYGKPAAVDRLLGAWEQVLLEEASLHVCLWHAERLRGATDAAVATAARASCNGYQSHLPETLLIPSLRRAHLRGRWRNCTAACSCACAGRGP
uniref:Uncharacterized protein n=1 Tax=Coccolithus braarudii TaxID=221442 RepID=A0A7S0Q5I2_9EUKA|mmetsp:Transcript_37576/g.80029  ORF Transcript_37576/g.80029 Transcript_37576/m.80029 type:complete len:317 (+) Transcript_37576:229-1179(+)